MGAAIQSAQFDWLYIQFYNNDECSAYQLFDNDGGTFNYDEWVSYVAGTPSEDAKLFIGLPATTLASTDDNSGSKYYISPSNLVTLVKDYSSHAQFGGVMLWDAGYSDTVSQNGCNYAQEVHSVLNTGAAC
jgi:chitinase